MALLVGVDLRIACWSGFVVLALTWIAILPMDSGTDHGPIREDHLQCAGCPGVLTWSTAGRCQGFAMGCLACPSSRGTADWSNGVAPAVNLARSPDQAAANNHPTKWWMYSRATR